MNNKYSERDLINGLRQERDEIIKFVYENFKSRAFKVVLSNSGSEMEAESIFHDSLIVLIENIRADKFKGDSEVATYLTGIVKFKWLNALRKKGLTFDKNNEYLNSLDSIEEEDDDLKNLEEDKYNLLNAAFSELKEDCKKLLSAYYYKQNKLKEIAVLMDYTESFIRVKKLRCMNALKSIIEKKK